MVFSGHFTFITLCLMVFVTYCQPHTCTALGEVGCRFQILSAERTFFLRAETKDEAAHWVRELENYRSRRLEFARWAAVAADRVKERQQRRAALASP